MKHDLNISILKASNIYNYISFICKCFKNIKLGNICSKKTWKYLLGKEMVVFSNKDNIRKKTYKQISKMDERDN